MNNKKKLLESPQSKSHRPLIGYEQYMTHVTFIAREPGLQMNVSEKIWSYRWQGELRNTHRHTQLVSRRHTADTLTVHSCSMWCFTHSSTLTFIRNESIFHVFYVTRYRPNGA